MKHLYIITAFLLCCLCIKAQEPTQKESTITISGTVLDEFNAPIPGANVFLKDRPGVGTVTNMDGKFTIKGAQMGDVITLSFLGYEKQEVRIDSRLDRKNAQFKLKPSTNTLEDVYRVLFPCKTVVNREKTSLNSGYVVSELSVPTKVHWY